MDPHAVNLAVVAGAHNRETRIFDLRYGVFYGTAFCLAQNLFVTAAHVFRAAQVDTQQREGDEVALARFTPDNFYGQTVQDFEVFDGIDLALLHCPGLEAELLRPNFNALTYLDDVFAMGFPFGFEPPVFHLRAFKGHIVTRRGLTVLPAEPPGYELSFIPPPGLSGAPLLFKEPGGAITIRGMIMQHHTAEYLDRRMELGIALDIEEILTLESRMVGGSIAERIFRLPQIHRERRNP
jgi:hypothetical protein